MSRLSFFFNQPVFWQSNRGREKVNLLVYTFRSNNTERAFSVRKPFPTGGFYTFYRSANFILTHSLNKSLPAGLYRISSRIYCISLSQRLVSNLDCNKYKLFIETKQVKKPDSKTNLKMERKNIKSTIIILL